MVESLMQDLMPSPLKLLNLTPALKLRPYGIILGLDDSRPCALQSAYLLRATMDNSNWENVPIFYVEGAVLLVKKSTTYGNQQSISMSIVWQDGMRPAKMRNADQFVSTILVT